MPAPEPEPAHETRLFFGALRVLLVEENQLQADIVSSFLAGFRAHARTHVASAATAQAHLLAAPVELVLVGDVPDQGGGTGLVEWLRRQADERRRQTPIILLSGHTPESEIRAARDCGANFVIAKPVTAAILYERVLWLSRDRRDFIVAQRYAGPDRRFHNLGPPGDPGRRHDDLPLAMEAATEQNLSQDEIDAMLKPRPFRAPAPAR